MNRYRRFPAILILAVAIGLGALYVRKSGGHAAGNGQSLAELERQISAGHATPAIWMTYAERLSDAHRYEQAATAYRTVLESDSSNKLARIGCAASLAQANKPDDFFNFMREVIATDPKQAMEIMERRECQTLSGDSRYKTVQQDAKAQAMD